MAALWATRRCAGECALHCINPTNINININTRIRLLRACLMICIHTVRVAQLAHAVPRGYIPHPHAPVVAGREQSVLWRVVHDGFHPVAVAVQGGKAAREGEQWRVTCDV